MPSRRSQIQLKPLTRDGRASNFAFISLAHLRENIPIDLYRKLRSGERLKKSQWILGLVVLAGAGRPFCLGARADSFRFSRLWLPGGARRLAQDRHRRRLHLRGLCLPRSALEPADAAQQEGPALLASGNPGHRLYRRGVDRPRRRPGPALPGRQKDRRAVELANCRLHRRTALRFRHHGAHHLLGHPASGAHRAASASTRSSGRPAMAELAVTLLGGLFLVVLRVTGGMVAALLEGSSGLLPKSSAPPSAAKCAPFAPASTPCTTSPISAIRHRSRSACGC